LGEENKLAIITPISKEKFIGGTLNEN
jgi:hypothetical protein